MQNLQNGFSFVTTIQNGNEIMRIASVRDIEEPPEELINALELLFNMPTLRPQDLINSIEQEIMNQSFEDNEPIFQGASQYIIDTTLGKSKWYKLGNWKDEKCSICLTEFEDKETQTETKPKRFYVRDLPCCKQNKFHKRCIDKWFRSSSFSCPCCRKKFDKESEPNSESVNSN